MAKRASDSDLAELGDRLRALREDLGLTQAEVADRLGITDGGYGHFERGRRFPSAAELPWLAGGLGVSTIELLSRLGLLRRDPSSSALPDQLANSFRSIAANWADLPERDRRMVEQILGMASSFGRSTEDTVGHGGSPRRKDGQQNSFALYLDCLAGDPLRTARAPIRELAYAGA